MSHDRPVRVRAARRTIAEEHGHDVRKLGEHYRELERTTCADLHCAGRGAAEVRREARTPRG